MLTLCDKGEPGLRAPPDAFRPTVNSLKAHTVLKSQKPPNGLLYLSHIFSI